MLSAVPAGLLLLSNLSFNHCLSVGLILQLPFEKVLLALDDTLGALCRLEYLLLKVLVLLLQPPNPILHGLEHHTELLLFRFRGDHLPALRNGRPDQIRDGIHLGLEGGCEELLLLDGGDRKSVV